MTGLTCLFNPVGCFTNGLGAWIHSIPLLYLLGGALIVGMLLGAWLGRWGVAVVLAIGAAFLVLRKRGDDTPAENVTGPDAEPPFRKPKPPADIFGQKRKKH